MTALSTYAELMRRSVALADFLTAEGFRARVHDPLGRGVAIHYAVEAGLGQLGLNGQLLTPAAGSRCRILLLNTDAPLDLDRPADYGIPNLCDECQICVRRCPPGAIPLHRAHHRGVLKSKINTKRCFPVVAQVRGCAICMKVCPVQRYGLRAVFEEYERSGEILGKGTDELEGFDWPPDGQRYGPGEKPRMTDELMFPPGFELGVTAGPGHFDHPDTSGRTWA
jgi:ferredoxin